MDAVLNLGLVFGLYQAISFFQLADPANVPYIRVLYASSLLCQLACYYYIQRLIKSQADKTALKYVEAKKPFSEETEDTVVSTTNQEYDLGQVQAAVIQVGCGCG
jgi:hypothetical protein